MNDEYGVVAVMKDSEYINTKFFDTLSGAIEYAIRLAGAKGVKVLTVTAERVNGVEQCEILIKVVGSIISVNRVCEFDENKDRWYRKEGAGGA